MYFVSSVRDITLIDWKTEYCGKPDVEDLPVSRALFSFNSLFPSVNSCLCTICIFPMAAGFSTDNVFPMVADFPTDNVFPLLMRE